MGRLKLGEGGGEKKRVASLYDSVATRWVFDPLPRITLGTRLCQALLRSRSGLADPDVINVYPAGPTGLRVIRIPHTDA